MMEVLEYLVFNDAVLSILHELRILIIKMQRSTPTSKLFAQCIETLHGWWNSYGCLVKRVPIGGFAQGADNAIRQ